MQTFREQVFAFWEWFPTVAAEFSDLLDDESSAQAAVKQVSQQMNKLLPTLSWTMGKEAEDEKSFTVTGEGQIARQLLAEFWHSQAVDVPGWTFLGSKQPSARENIEGMSIGLGDEVQVDADGFLFKTSVDEEHEQIDITAWNPTYAKVGEEHHMPILFIFLDETLGEFGTQSSLGEIKVEPIEPAKDTRSLIELPAFIDSVYDYHEWKKIPPLEMMTLYENSQQTDSPRGDTLFGSSCIPHVVFEFLESRGELENDPLEGSGAEFGYIALDASVFPDGNQVDVRANIEDTINDELRKHASGRTLGGAFGIGHSYIEFLALDGENSWSIVQNTLNELKLGSLSRIESF